MNWVPSAYPVRNNTPRPMATPGKKDTENKPASLPPAWVGDAISTTKEGLGVIGAFCDFDDAEQPGRLSGNSSGNRDSRSSRQSADSRSSARSSRHQASRGAPVSSTQNKSLRPPGQTVHPANASRPPKGRVAVILHEPPLGRPSVPQSSKSAWTKTASATSRGGAAAGLVGAGGVLVCDTLKSILGENKVDLGKPVDPKLVEAILDVGEKTEQYENALRDFLAFCTSTEKVELPDEAEVSFLTWMQLRDRSVSELRKLASNIDTHHKNVNITTVTTAGVGVTAGAVTLATIFAPFTFGLSLAVGAAAVGAAAGLTALGASLTEMGLTKSICSTAQEYIDADGKRTEKLYSHIDHLNKCAEELRLSTQKLDEWDSLEVVKTVFVAIGGLGTVASSATPLARGAMMMNPGVRSLAKQMAKVPRAEWAAKFGSRASGKTWSAAKSLAKQTPSLAGKGARVFGSVLAGVGVIFDVYTLITTSIDLANGSVSAAGTALREKANLLQSEKQEITALIEELRKSQN